MDLTSPELDVFWKRVGFYSAISDESRSSWSSLAREKSYKKQDYFVVEGQVPKTVAFVTKGLFSQYFTAENGDVVIKRFFPEQYFMASLSAMLGQTKSMFTIRALENSSVIEFNFHDLRQLIKTNQDIANFYIRYIELHWIIEKEPQEISLRYESAGTRYDKFLRDYPALELRVKQHEIASYLGITPTQLSRIRAER